MDCSSPGSSVHGTLQARILEWDPLLQGIFLTHGLYWHFPHCRQILYGLRHQEISQIEISIIEEKHRNQVWTSFLLL